MFPDLRFVPGNVFTVVVVVWSAIEHERWPGFSEGLRLRRLQSGLFERSPSFPWHLVVVPPFPHAQITPVCPPTFVSCSGMSLLLWLLWSLRVSSGRREFLAVVLRGVDLAFRKGENDQPMLFQVNAYLPVLHRRVFAVSWHVGGEGGSGRMNEWDASMFLSLRLCLRLVQSGCAHTKADWNNARQFMDFILQDGFQGLHIEFHQGISNSLIPRTTLAGTCGAGWTLYTPRMTDAAANSVQLLGDSPSLNTGLGHSNIRFHGAQPVTILGWILISFST
jgi:hypothetical protein